MANKDQMRAACLGFCREHVFDNMDEKALSKSIYLGPTLGGEKFRLLKGGYMFECVAEISEDSPDADISLAYCVFIALADTIGFEPFRYF